MIRNEYKQVKETGASTGMLPALLKAQGFALALTLLIFFICALLLTYTGLPEGAIPFITTLTVVLSVVIAGAVLAKTVGRRGYLNGSLAGIVYALVLYVLSIVLSGDFHFSPYILILACICLVGGAFGGIIGINLSGKRRH